ncbi:hypothetical protein Ccrd_021804 [Cynara cardunculus var. scolymus]|uniref:Thioredoxin-like fold n=1 Tax=Cynara cardunculus var. scolymus TaxID=59895 RepID=A0A103Y056_CYNCS|nr:hypothetical protein Ccrd_021804 [Cynara cardunculus var. scolymus]
MGKTEAMEATKTQEKPINRHGNLTTASSDENLKDIFHEIRTSRSPAVINFDIDECPETTQHIRYTPTFHFYRDGERVDAMFGAGFRFENLGGLPGEIRIFATKMAISSSLLVPVVATPLQVEINRHHPWPKVEILLDQDKDILIWDCSSFIRVHKHGKGLSHTNSVRNLNEAPPCKSRSYYTLSSLPNNISTTPVHFGRILSGECTSTVSSPSTIGVDDNLPAG